MISQLQQTDTYAYMYVRWKNMLGGIEEKRNKILLELQRY